MDAPPRHAVVICTRNRPDDLRRTVHSLDAQDLPGPTMLLVMDASNPEPAAANRATVEQAAVSGAHHAYTGRPSLTRQRNAAVDALPPSVELVYFLDDDVTLHPGYLRRTARVFAERPSAGGVGGRQVPPPDYPDPASRVQAAMRTLFLLDHPQPGRLLPSGHVSLYHRHTPDAPFQVDWLSGFSCAFRRELLERYRFSPDLEGYSLYEDRELSVRIGREAPLWVEPRATLTHHTSPQNRYDAERYAYASVIHQWWLVQQVVSHPLKEFAYAWSQIGRYLALCAASGPTAASARAGFLRGLRDLLTRNHPLIGSGA